MSQDEQLNDQSVLQRKISFANSEHVSIVIQILNECGGVPGLVGTNEFTTIVNAVTLEAQQDMIKRFINALENIKSKNFEIS